jgi:hypothetical protein
MAIITVRVPRNLTLEEAQKVVANIVKSTGHPHCFSGNDIRFTNAVDYAVDPDSLEVREVVS